MEASETEKKFVTNFILKHRRERSLYVLNQEKKRYEFLHRFNHNWVSMIAQKHLIEINTKSNDELYDKIKSSLKFKDSDLCLLMSYDENDRTFLSFKEAFEVTVRNGFAIFLISLNGDKYYLKTEEGFGNQKKFVGRIKTK